MNEVLAIGLQGMQGDMARLEQVGMNLANALTPGYKRGVSVQGPVAATFAAQISAAAETTAASPAQTATRVAAATDSRAGTLKFTGQSLDVALPGNGYFEVMTPAGPAYTRNGSFRVDSLGRLVTAQGHAVMGTGGEITLKTSTPTIDASGAIVSSTSPEAQSLGRLKVVEFEATARLERLGDNLLAGTSAVKPLADGAIEVRQGFLENSNVNSTFEMTSLIQTMRHFESMQKVVQAYDDMLGNAIRKLGEN